MKYPKNTINFEKARGCALFRSLLFFGYFIVEFVAVSLGDGGGCNEIYKLLEMMFSGHIAIQYMFCMFLMIEKMTLEGFTGLGEAKYEG